MLYSENYASIARCDKKTGQISVEVRPLELSDGLFAEITQSKSFLTITLPMAVLTWFLIFFLPAMAALAGWISFKTLNVILIFGPTMVTTFIIGSQLLRSYQKWHGAEHKAIEAYEKHHCWDFTTIKSMPRESIMCGTRFISGQLFLSLIFAVCGIGLGWDFLVNWLIYLVIKISLGFLDNSGLLIVPPISWVNIAVQKYVTTQEPSDLELDTAQTALVALIRKDSELGSLIY